MCKDYIVRATAADGQIRAFAATTRDTVETARKAHNTSPVATAALGRLLTAGAMMGVMMKGEKDLLTLPFWLLPSCFPHQGKPTGYGHVQLKARHAPPSAESPQEVPAVAMHW